MTINKEELAKLSLADLGTLYEYVQSNQHSIQQLDTTNEYFSAIIDEMESRVVKCFPGIFDKG